MAKRQLNSQSNRVRDADHTPTAEELAVINAKHERYSPIHVTLTQQLTRMQRAGFHLAAYKERGYDMVNEQEEQLFLSGHYNLPVHDAVDVLDQLNTLEARHEQIRQAVETARQASRGELDPADIPSPEPSEPAPDAPSDPPDGPTQ